MYQRGCMRLIIYSISLFLSICTSLFGDQEIYETDIAIIGGGVGGTYSAWRLINSNTGSSRQQIDLYEMSDRIGGRLYSLILPGMPHVPAELGGMRFFPTHAMVRELVNLLKLPVIDFPSSGPDGNITFIRNHHLRDKDFLIPEKIPYALSLQERGKTPSELISYVINTLIPEGIDASPADWNSIRQKRQLEGKPLYKYGFWSLLDWVLTREAMDLINDAGGYDAPYRNWNAAEAFDAFKNSAPGGKISAKMIATGFQSLPETLAKEFEKKGGKIHKQYRLKSLQKVPGQEDNRIRLTFEWKGAEGTKEQVVIAKRVILGLPRRSIELLTPDSVLFQYEQVKQDIASITPQAAIKLFLGYHYPWWKVLGLVGGKSVTDLEIKQTYYFGTEEDRPNGEKGNRNSLLLAAYADGKVLDYWEPLSRGNIYSGMDYMAGKVSMPNESGATNNQVFQAQKELKLVHALKYMPVPYTAAYMDWSKDPYGGAYSFWKFGIDVISIMKRMRHPIENLPIYICGDSYSDLQGWVEGALTNTELMLEEHFGLKRPDWIPKDYDVGPTVL